MSGSLVTQIVAKINATGAKALDLGTPVDPLSIDWTTLLSDGVAANQASQMWHDQRTLGASATEDLDLFGTLVNAFGVTMNFAKVKAIAIKAAAANTNNVNVTRPAANGVPIFLAASDGIALTPGAWFIMVFPNLAGVAVTTGTGDLITITNSAGSTTVTYDVVIIGCD